VPTGNFGDVFAGYIAKKMGLPINKLIVATNKNDILKRVISTGIYKPKEVLQTISPSMDIQIASNFERLIFYIHSNDDQITLKKMEELKKNNEFKLNGEQMSILRNDFISESLSEDETKDVIKKINKNYNILVDPHTAIGIGALDKLSNDGINIILSTAHPSKFPEVVKEATGKHPELPPKIKKIIEGKEKFDILPNDLNIIKKFPNFFLFKENKIFLKKEINNFKKRTYVINQVFNFLVKKKLILSKHREYFPVFKSFKSKPLLKVQRVIGPFFGFQFFGVHLNGFLKKNNKYFMWVGRRTKKGNFPNDLDQIAAGGLPFNVTIKKNLIKESYEEANINKTLILKSKYDGTISYRVETKLGMSRHILFCYNLELPMNFIPKNNDGEITNFYLWPIQKILKIIKQSRKFKFDCSLVIILFALNKKIIQIKKIKRMLNNKSDLKILKKIK